MMGMLAPDLLDRRALALLRLVDVSGRPVEGPVRIEGEKVRTVAKGGGAFALMEAAGFEAYSASFPDAPAAPTTKLHLDLTPAAGGNAPRAIDLTLPREPDPALSAQASSLFQPVRVEMLPSPSAVPSGSACAVRVEVRRKDDGRRIENALVRGRSDNGLFAARALTDARGQACLIFPFLPLAFAGATVEGDLPARIAVDVEPGALFHDEEGLDAARRAAASRTVGHVDPDALETAAGPLAAGTGEPVRIAAGRQLSISISWGSQ